MSGLGVVAGWQCSSEVFKNWGGGDLEGRGRAEGSGVTRGSDGTGNKATERRLGRGKEEVGVPKEELQPQRHPPWPSGGSREHFLHSCCCRYPALHGHSILKKLFGGGGRN